MAPICLILFNRPDCTRHVFNRIAAAKPERLYLIADGPRSDVPGDDQRCAESRAVVANPSWDCDIVQLYSDTNMGSRLRITSGLDAVFEREEECIILEDDCFPDASFFPYCNSMLQKFREDERIMMISGTNFVPASRLPNASYWFSRYPSIWGWATWRRAWRLLDRQLSEWPRLHRERWLLDVIGSKEGAAYFAKLFTANLQKPQWDYALLYSLWTQHALGVVPRVNLISNIGWGPSATQTKVINPHLAFRKIEALALPLTHPCVVAPNRLADDLVLSRAYGVPLSLSGRLLKTGEQERRRASRLLRKGMRVAFRQREARRVPVPRGS